MTKQISFGTIWEGLVTIWTSQIFVDEKLKLVFEMKITEMVVQTTPMLELLLAETAGLD